MKAFEFGLGDTTRHVLNLSDYVLSDTESFVLSHGLNFGLPPVAARAYELQSCSSPKRFCDLFFSNFL